MTGPSKKQKIRAAIDSVGRESFTKGVMEGSRLMLSLLMGLPRPNRVMRDSDLEPGEIIIVANPTTALQEERIDALARLLDTIKDTDIATAMRAEGVVVEPAKRLENIVAYIQEESQMDGANFIREAVLALARGEPVPE